MKKNQMKQNKRKSLQQQKMKSFFFVVGKLNSNDDERNEKNIPPVL